MNPSPVLDGQNIQRDANGIVTIKPLPVILYVVIAFVLVLGLGAFARGQTGMGFGALVVAGVIYYRARSAIGTVLEFNPTERVFKISSNSQIVLIPFDDIAGFAVATEKEGMNFTEKQILVVLKDNRSIQIGVITDANAQKREEKVANLMKFLNEATGI